MIKYKILIVEDNETDADLAEREIKKTFPDCVFMRVCNKPGFINALETFNPDVIVSDYSMPAFSGMEALMITLEKKPVTPFIIYTGSQNEETAVECMKAGATDYVLKNNIIRLTPAIERAIELRNIKIEKSKANKALVESESKFRVLLDSVDKISVKGFDPNGIINYWNNASERIYGFSAKEAIGKSVIDLIIPEEIKDDVTKQIKIMAENYGVLPPGEVLVKKKGGERIFVFSNHVVLKTSEGPEFYWLDVDLTERNNAINEVKQNEKRLRSLVTILQNLSDGEHNILEIAVEEALKITSSKLGFIFTYNGDFKNFVVKTWSKSIKDVYKIDDPQILEELENDELWSRAIIDRKPIINNNFTSRGGKTEGLLRISRHLTLPVFFENKLVALIAVANKESNYIESDGLQLSLLMGAAWKALESRKNEQEKLFLSTATEQSPISVIITDPTGRIKFVNQKFMQSTRYTKEELEGRTLRIFKPGHLSAEENLNMVKTINAGTPWRGEVMNTKRDGTSYWETVNISPICDINKNITHFLVLSEDITARKKMENDLMAAKDKAEENDRLKTAFLNNLSHEIRTPLNAVVGYAQLLNSDFSNEERLKKYSEIILQGSNQLLAIMDNLITMALIESGQLKINKTRCNLNKLLNNVYNQLKQKADQKNINLQSSALFSRYEADVVIDEIKVIQVLANLIDNAIKYTESGYVKFGCSVSDKEIHFFVADTGIGIPDDMKDVVFERFRQGSNRPGYIQEGLGLGLSIAKSYVEFMGGNLTIETKENSGSKISFTVPYKTTIVESSAPVRHEGLNLSSSKTILIVDDVEVNYYLVTEILEDIEIELIYAASGNEAINKVLTNEKIDLVLMDIKMPGMDGYTATREIKKIRPELPIIAQTAYALAGDRQKSIDRGCNDYIAKPITRASLIGLLKKYL